MKKVLIAIAILIVLIICLLAYYHYVPFWATIVSTGAFIVGCVAGWLTKSWSDKHITRI